MNLIVFIVPGCILLPLIVVFLILIKKYFKYSKYYKKLETKLSVDKCIDLSVYTLTKSSFNKELGICAGEIYYHDVWTRDAFCIFGFVDYRNLSTYPNRSQHII